MKTSMNHQNVFSKCSRLQHYVNWLFENTPMKSMPPPPTCLTFSLSFSSYFTLDHWQPWFVWPLGDPGEWFGSKLLVKGCRLDLQKYQSPMCGCHGCHTDDTGQVWNMDADEQDLQMFGKFQAWKSIHCGVRWIKNTKHQHCPHNKIIQHKWTYNKRKRTRKK